MLKINELTRLYLGIQGENETREITIDVSPWIMLYPNASVTIWHKRNGDATPSATGATYDADTKTITWSPTSTDTYVSGEGEAEVRLTDGSVLKKSKAIMTGVSPSVTLAGTTLGSDWASYINAVDSLREKSEKWATGGTTGTPSATNNSKYYSQQSASSAQTAEAYAVGTRGGTDVSSDDPAYHNNAKYYAEFITGAVDASEAWATGGSGGTPSATNNSKYYSEQAASSASAAASSASSVGSQAQTSEAYAIGKRSGVDVTSGDPAYHNNSRYYSEQASGSATAASGSATTAGGKAQDSEAYAVGKRGGVDVTSGDAAYHNNSKYFSEQSSESATSAGNSATAAAGDAEDAEAYGAGTRNGTDVGSSDPAYHNNAKYYSGQASSSASDAATAKTAAETAAASASAAYGTALLAPNYSSTSTYKVGDHVIYSGNYYVCNTAITTAEAWTAAHWTQVTVGGEESALKSAITHNMNIVQPVNKWNPNALESGYILANGNKGSNSSYNHLLEPIPVSKNDVVRAYYRKSNGTIAAKGMRWFCAYDSTKAAVSASGSNSNISSYTVPEGIAYVNPTIDNNDSDVMVTVSHEATYWIAYEAPYYIAGTGFHSSVLIDEETDFDDKYLDYSMTGRFDPDDCETGKIVSASTGTTSANASYFTTDYMPIRTGETLYFYRKDTKALKNARIIAAYDKNKTVIPGSGVSSETDHYQQSGDVAYVKCSFAYDATDFVRMPEGTSVMANSSPVYCTGGVGDPVLKNKYTRDKIFVSTSDTEAQIIQKFVYAFNKGDCDVIFERGSYSFGTELAKVSTDYGVEHNEIPIGNNCRYYFNGSTLTATIDLSQHPAVDNEEFYCNFFGCQRRPSSYEMYDGVLHATDTRYVVHDESSALAGSYRHLYQNMEMYYHTDDRTEDIRKCIGGGTGASGVVEIVGCKFTTDGTSNCVSYHGNGTDVVGASFDVNVRNCWFSNGFRTNQMSEHQTARIFYTGNSAIWTPIIDENCTLTSFLNETRT